MKQDKLSHVWAFRFETLLPSELLLNSHLTACQMPHCCYGPCSPSDTDHARITTVAISDCFCSSVWGQFLLPHWLFQWLTGQLRFILLVVSYIPKQNAQDMVKHPLRLQRWASWYCRTMWWLPNLKGSPPTRNERAILPVRCTFSLWKTERKHIQDSREHPCVTLLQKWRKQHIVTRKLELTGHFPFTSPPNALKRKSLEPTLL